jgi:glycosyltransferase involved in cell wall biosynthesis
VASQAGDGVKNAVTVCCGTFGDWSWVKTAERAIASATEQGVPVVHRHRSTLAEARNACLDVVETEWVAFLDADDELEAHYFDALAWGTADLRAPAVRYVQNGKAHRPYVPKVAGHRHACTGECLPQGNWLVIGTAARAQMLRDVGGFEEWPVYEDWALWLRCWQAGASVEAVPQAIYRAHVSPTSRNRAPAIADRNRVHHEIVDAVLGQSIAA